MTQAELLSMAAMVGDASDSIYEALKYICFISYENFYELNVKDIFKVALHDITDKTLMSRLGIKLFPEQIGDLARPEFAELKKLIRYAFAVRVPFLKKYVPGRSNFSDNDIKLLFGIICDQGAENIDGLVTSDFKNNLKAIKAKGQDEPIFDTEWFKSFVYTHGKEFSAITNRNMFFLGCADALFPLYWASLTDRLLEVVEGGGAER
ncbi:MAG: hypothetical protein K2K41_00970 [Ruminiclostridium sp.]|nr:hypothetical protein [Ruminiclostridium sp.]